VSELASRLVTTFHYVIREQSGNDVTVARAKTMLALANLTWSALAIEVAPHFISQRRMVWKSEAFEAVGMGGSFRRDPVGDDASIIIDEYDPSQFAMTDEMTECASFLPLFGRQALERFNLTLARIYQFKEGGHQLPPPENAPDDQFPCQEEYHQLFGWFQSHGVLDEAGDWQEPCGEPVAAQAG